MDSPISGPGFSYLFLEDFEDGAFNTPGATLSAGTVTAPGAFTDSVDGSGAFGRSLLVSTTNALTVTFNAGALGGFPTHAGIVWTDVGSAEVSGFDDVFFEAFDASSASLGVLGPFFLGDGSAISSTAEDRFFGIINAGGISSFTITMGSSTDWEVDHIQYARAIAAPEPGSLALLALPLLGVIARRKP